MAAVLNFSPPTVFSSCSASDLNLLVNDGGDKCLFNVPDDVVGDPVCGNRILEEDEACDCGTPAECNNDCCDAATCQLVAGVECGSGACCTSECTLAAAGTVCRPSQGDCDIEEVCPGGTNECPANALVANGMSCNSDSGHCLDGECSTHEEQCTALFASKD